MITKINQHSNCRATINYLENKGEQGGARFLSGHNAIALERGRVIVQQKVRELENYAGMDPRISKPYLHAIISFYRGEIISRQLLDNLLINYLDELGYGDQPYLVYRHEDTTYPCVSVVSVSIDADGKRISDSHLHRRSHQIRIRLEADYGLKTSGKVPPAGDQINAEEL